MIEENINRIRTEGESVFNEVDTWFSVNVSLLNYDPVGGGWNIRKILEHISLTNHFLLILIRKGTLKAIEKSATENFTSLLAGYNLDWGKLKAIGEHQSFYWNRPEHMEPTGSADLAGIQMKLRQQFTECMDYLDRLKNGEGVLYKTTMSVNGLGKIDVYHYILFLILHAKRHIEQMSKVKQAYNAGLE